MLSETRRLSIVNLLAHDLTKAVSVAELSERLGVSEMTIRRDLDWLARRSLATRVHGGAVAFQGPEIEKAFSDRLGDSRPQKKSVGWAAAQLVTRPGAHHLLLVARIHGFDFRRQVRIHERPFFC